MVGRCTLGRILGVIFITALVLGLLSITLWSLALASPPMARGDILDGHTEAELAIARQSLTQSVCCQDLADDLSAALSASNDAYGMLQALRGVADELDRRLDETPTSSLEYPVMKQAWYSVAGAVCDMQYALYKLYPP